ncbi:1-acyl-sn-glycerol-3-phosphate acyltransferase [Aquirufa sp. OSTEICH-129V]|uniref:1-acyl-sn-glycerol-3-phosphate acyltransferase n=1 Tax=Aquirufa avitistagni TaxID=3104728 RepID=A0ABW6DGC5_9BACT
MARLALWIFCPRVRIEGAELMAARGTLLIVANHPDSFLDAVILGAYYPRKLHFLARGDVFRKPLYGFLLRSIGMIPIHRAREGREHLHLNEGTFQESVEVLRRGDGLLIFIEGICLLTHEIQPFKKGATRILESAQAAGIQPMVHVVGLGYSDFRAFGKVIHVAIESFSEQAVFDHARHRLDFNAAVREQMVRLVRVPDEVVVLRKGLFYYLNLPFFRLVSDYVWSRTAGTVFYDSVLFGVLLFTYPIYLVVLSVLFHGLFGIPMAVTMLALPVGFRLTNMRVVKK